MFARQGRGKKLTGAARYWAGWSARSTGNGGRADDPPEWQAVIEAHEESNGAEIDVFAVWPENWPTVSVFIKLRNCWRIDGFTGHCFGLDRPSIESTIKMMRIKKGKRPEILEKLIIMENEALPILNRKNP